MEQKGAVTEMGKKNREMLSIHRAPGSLKRAAKKLGEKTAELMAVIHHRELTEQKEAQEKRRELEQVMDAAIEAVTQETDAQQPVADRPAQEKQHDRER